MSEYHHTELKVIQEKVFDEADANLRHRLTSISRLLREVINLSIVPVERLKFPNGNGVNAEMVLSELVQAIFDVAKHANRALEAERFIDRVRSYGLYQEGGAKKGGAK